MRESTMIKVGLITCYMDNYGACLQAYALQTTIKRITGHCEILRYSPIRSMKEYPFPLNVLLRLRKKVKAITNDAYRYGNARAKEFNDFRRKYLIFSKKYYRNESSFYRTSFPYNCFVTGSDQIWNPNLYGGTNNKIYFLDFVPKEARRVAYAPSIGVSAITPECKEDMKQLLSKFDAISVREADGKQIIDEISNVECKLVLDPTLLLPNGEWEELISPRLIREEYIFLYLFSEKEYIGEVIERAKQQLNMKVVTIPFVKREFDSDDEKIQSAGPLDFLNLIKYASLVITDSFHATAFSINLNTPFYSLLRNDISEKNNMNSRVYNILHLTGLEKRLISNSNYKDTEISTELDFSDANQRLQKKRAEDYDFLIDALQENK